ncbi:hypothetical protein BAU01nite_25670 [Brevibacterium aurantiacum]|nr:hypothetical protein BAU01nite_25670 [Brevibacterium aurantiacum]
MLVRIGVVVVLGHDRFLPADDALVDDALVVSLPADDALVDDALVVSLLRSGEPQMSPRLVDVNAIELGFPRVEFIVKLAFHGR